MKKLFVAAFLGFACSLSGLAQEASKGQVFGKDFQASQVVGPAEIATQLAKQDSAYVQTRGVIKEVCQQKGCWMKVDAGNGQEMMVRFKNYAFFVPKDAAGKEVVLNGKAFEYESPVPEQRHYAQDAGKSKKEVASIKKAKQEIRFVADGVIIY